MDDKATPRLWAYALIGHEDRLLLVPSAEPDGYVLPGAAVLCGEPVEHELRRALHQQFAAVVEDVEFYAAVEHGTRDRNRGSRSGVALLFDVTFTEPDGITRPGQHVWVDDRELTDLALRPGAVKDCLLRAPLSARRPWWAWTP